MEGWICLYRKFQENELWTEPRVFSKAEAWLSLLMKANHEQRTFMLGNQMVTVHPGELITSEVKLAQEWRWSRHKVRNYVQLLEKRQNGHNKPHNKVHKCNHSKLGQLPETGDSTGYNKRHIDGTSTGHKQQL